MTPPPFCTPTASTTDVRVLYSGGLFSGYPFHLREEVPPRGRLSLRPCQHCEVCEGVWVDV